jgi:hypothetical protein
MREAHHEGRLTVTFLYEESVPVAFIIFVGDAGVLYALKTGYRESRADSEPGLNLMAASVQREFLRKRWGTLDLDCVTTHGDWKHRWATWSEEVVSYYLFRRNALSRAAAGLYRCKKWAERLRGAPTGAAEAGVDVPAGGEGPPRMEGPR